MRTHSLLLLLALLGTAHCASAPRWRSDSGDAAPVSREEFDPRTLDENLLIEPVQRENRDQAQTPAEPAAPVPEHALAASASVYRLQLVALSNEAMARQRRAELERALGGEGLSSGPQRALGAASRAIRYSRRGCGPQGTGRRTWSRLRRCLCRRGPGERGARLRSSRGRARVGEYHWLAGAY